MKEFDVSVQKQMTCTGSVKVQAENGVDAIRKVKEQIRNGKLDTSSVEWGDPEYEDCSFDTTGDVD